ncbi:restriction endonuclease [Butyrivibrio sp. YAB3001]|uniref:restriction endonuclease n=1 Tax=Butyrivibrio sp. YAB3001 TaxID=1520812 RepID=UPI0008F68FB3|nr:restriction endonuclease [Butyrivibrio sp. YAB3001]SFC09823.1 Restriction endonuclease [Butyrivibrio sp. YAB3001]
MSKEYYFACLIGAGIVLLAGVIFFVIKAIRNKPLPMDEMEGHDFEYYCAELLKKHGFIDVEVTRGSGDFGADILAEKDGISYAVQCKCYDKPIGVKAVQEIYAGRDYYDCMVGVVMTNQYFTQPAMELAEKLKIVLWDRGYVDAMEEEEVKRKKA